MKTRMQNVRTRARTKQRLTLGAQRLRGVFVFVIGSAWRILPYLLVAVLVMAVPILGVQAYRYMVTSEHFTLRELVIEGNKRLDNEEVRALANISEGLNLLALDELIVKADIEQHPWVRRADVNVELPERLRIRITEREAAALVALGAMYFADDRGVVFKRWEVGDPLDGLPIITGIDRDSLEQDGTVESAENVIRDAVQLAKTYSRHPVSELLPLGEVHHDRLMGWKIVTVDSMEVQLGTGSVPEKLDRLLRVVQDLTKRGNTADVVRMDDSIDPSRVAVRVRTISDPTSEPKTKLQSKDKQGSAKSADDKKTGAIQPQRQPANTEHVSELDDVRTRTQRNQILP